MFFLHTPSPSSSILPTCLCKVIISVPCFLVIDQLSRILLLLLEWRIPNLQPQGHILDPFKMPVHVPVATELTVSQIKLWLPPMGKQSLLLSFLFLIRETSSFLSSFQILLFPPFLPLFLLLSGLTKFYNFQTPISVSLLILPGPQPSVFFLFCACHLRHCCQIYPEAWDWFYYAFPLRTSVPPLCLLIYIQNPQSAFRTHHKIAPEYFFSPVSSYILTKLSASPIWSAVSAWPLLSVVPLYLILNRGPISNAASLKNPFLIFLMEVIFYSFKVKSLMTLILPFILIVCQSRRLIKCYLFLPSLQKTYS